MDFINSYTDTTCAQAYNNIELKNTYYLAYRDIPEIISRHVNTGNKAIDFGCGAGRSTRFLKLLGFEVTGIDIANDMINIAKQNDPEGRYLHMDLSNGTGPLLHHSYDLILSVFTFDNIPTFETKVSIFNNLKELVHSNGKIISLVSNPEVYVNEWASFSTKDFPENRYAKCGDKVRIIITDSSDKRPVEDIIWPEIDYKRVYNHAGLEVIDTYKPLATGNEPYKWINETKISPWHIYVLRKA